MPPLKSEPSTEDAKAAAAAASAAAKAAGKGGGVNRALRDSVVQEGIRGMMPTPKDVRVLTAAERKRT